MTESIHITNEKKALVDMCLRNAIRYARGEIIYTMALHDQLQYAYDNSNKNTREVMKTIFDIVEFDE